MRVIAALFLVPLVFVPLAYAAEASELARILERVSEEAEAFAQNATKVIGTERLLHQGRLNPPRFQQRQRGAPVEQRPAAYVRREIFSEYGFGSFKEAPENLKEFRQVVSVDGRAVKEKESARLSLAENMKSDDDRLRKHMLQDFEQHGTIGAASDFGQLLLMFRRRSLERFDFTLLEGRRIGGAYPTLVVSYVQKQGKDGARVFHGRQMSVIAPRGEIWVRERDGLPLKVIINIPSQEDKVRVTHIGETDYVQSRHGFLVPSEVHYSRLEGDFLMVENFAFYGDFRIFKAEAEIKFTPEESAIETRKEPTKPK